MIEQRFVPKHNPDPSEAGVDHEEWLHKDRYATRGGARLPWVPPVIETLYPSIDGLPLGVFDEWAGECFIRRQKGSPRGSRSYRPRHWGWVPFVQLLRWLRPVAACVSRPWRCLLRMTDKAGEGPTEATECLC